MQAVIWNEYGPPEVLQVRDVANPVPAPDEFRVKVIASTIFAGDCEMRSCDFPPGFRLPVRLMFGWNKPRKAVQIPGQELAGIVDKVGSKISHVKPGDAIFAPAERFGAHAEYVCLRAKNPVAEIPANMSFEEAATVSVGGLNALHFLRKAGVNNGDHVLVHGAGGGIGTFAVQIAKSMGAEVTALDSTTKLPMLTSLGADHVIDYTQENFSENDRTYDVIIDVAGKCPFPDLISSLRENGRCVLGNPRLNTMARGLVTSLTGNRKVTPALTKYKTEDLTILKALIESGKVKTSIDKRYPLEHIRAAHRYVETGRKAGHVVINVQSEPAA